MLFILIGICSLLPLSLQIEVSDGFCDQGPHQLFISHEVQMLQTPHYPNSIKGPASCGVTLRPASDKDYVHVMLLDLYDVSGPSQQRCTESVIIVYGGASVQNASKMTNLCSGRDLGRFLVSRVIQLSYDVEWNEAGSQGYFRLIVWTSTSQREPDLASSRDALTLLTANEDVQFIAHYGFPQLYPSLLDSRYRVSTTSCCYVQLSVLYLITEHWRDVLAVYNTDTAGKKYLLDRLSGNMRSLTPRVIVSNSSAISLTFNSDSSHPMFGFILEYRAVSRASTTPTPSLIETEARPVRRSNYLSVALCLGAVALILLVLSLGVRLWRRRSAAVSRQQPETLQTRVSELRTHVRPPYPFPIDVMPLSSEYPVSMDRPRPPSYELSQISANVGMFLTSADEMARASTPPPSYEETVAKDLSDSEYEITV